MVTPINYADGSGLKISEETFYPSATAGDLRGLPDDVRATFKEATGSLAAGNWKACVLMCRTVIVEVGAEKGNKPKVSYVDHLDCLKKKGYITEPMMPWVDRIRTFGGGANHIPGPVSRARAEDTLNFTTQFLRIVYEMPEIAAQYDEKADADSSP